MVEGKVPGDRLALQQLVAELQAWPYLEQEEELQAAGAPEGYSPYAEITDTGVPLAERRRQAQAAKAREAGELSELEPAKDLSDFLPKWVGYSSIYVVMGIPVFITLSMLGLLFVSSLK